MAREIKADTEELRHDTAAIKSDTAQILAEIACLQARLPEGDQVRGGAGFTLQRYLDSLSSYAETSFDLSDNESDSEIDMEPSRIESDSGIEMEPNQNESDSEIDMEPSQNGSPSQDVASEDIFYDTSPLEQMPIKTPGPPPKNPTLGPSENPGLSGLKRSESSSKEAGISVMFGGLHLKSHPDNKRRSTALTKDEGSRGLSREDREVKHPTKERSENIADRDVTMSGGATEEDREALREARRARRAEKEASEKAAEEERRKKEDERREHRRKQEEEEDEAEEAEARRWVKENWFFSQTQAESPGRSRAPSCRS